MMLAHAYIAIRDLHADGGPAAPETWSRSVQGSTGWTMLEHPLGLLAAYRVNAIGARGLFAVFGPQAVLETIAANAGSAEVMPARELWRRRAETQPRKAVRAWRTWIVDDDGEPEVRRTLIDEGGTLPVTPPTVAVPWGTVTRLYRPALDATLAGHPLHTRLEDEPDRNP